MPIYEKRTYDIVVGQMPEVIRLYKEEGWPVLVTANTRQATAAPKP